MAKNDIILLDGVIEERVKLNLPSRNKAEAFEYLASEQIVKDYDLSTYDISNNIVDGRNDGGIDSFFIFINGHLLTDIDNFMWTKLNSVLQKFNITIAYASRGDTSCIGENILSKSNYIRKIVESYFSNCNISVDFWGEKELLEAYRKKTIMSLELKYTEVLSKNQNYESSCSN